MALQSVVIRVPTMEVGVGKVGYILARGEPDGTWRITEKNGKDHNLAATCDTPSAFMPALKDHLDRWLDEQRKMYEHNCAVVKSWPDVRPGWRKGWKERELVKERQQMERATRSFGTFYYLAAVELHKAGWIDALPADITVIEEHAEQP